MLKTKLDFIGDLYGLTEKIQFEPTSNSHLITDASKLSLKLVKGFFFSSGERSRIQENNIYKLQYYRRQHKWIFRCNKRMIQTL